MNHILLPSSIFHVPLHPFSLSLLSQARIASDFLWRFFPRDNEEKAVMLNLKFALESDVCWRNSKRLNHFQVFHSWPQSHEASVHWLLQSSRFYHYKSSILLRLFPPSLWHEFHSLSAFLASNSSSQQTLWHPAGQRSSSDDQNYCKCYNNPVIDATVPKLLHRLLRRNSCNCSIVHLLVQIKQSWWEVNCSSQKKSWKQWSQFWPLWGRVLITFSRNPSLKVDRH